MLKFFHNFFSNSNNWNILKNLNVNINMTILYSLFIVIPVTQEKISGKFLSIFK